MKKNYVMFLALAFAYSAQSQTITTIAGTGSSGFSGDGGQASAAKLNLPFNLTFDKSDNIYVADTYNNSIRRIDNESGIITTVVGTGDKKQVSELKTPTGLTFDNNNNLYVADLANLRIRKVNLDTGSAITLVGQKSATEFPNIDNALGGPFNVVFDRQGNLYVSVNGDSNVKKVDFTSGKVTVIAGNGEVGFSGDGGQAASAKLANPTGLALDHNGNLYISDSGNERIRKVNLSTGIITTIAGTGETGFIGNGVDATKAQMSNPLGLAIDNANNLYLVDRGNNMVRKINLSSGIITTVAGNGESGYSGDGELAKNATLSNPTGLAFNNNGDLFVVDRGNNSIRKISGLANEDAEDANLEASINVYPNPSTDKITIEMKNDVELKNISMYDVNGKEVKVHKSDNTLNVSKLPRGIYILKIATSDGSIEQKVVLE